MEFGKPDDPALVDWALPPDTALTRLQLGQLAGAVPAGARHVYVGSTAWATPELVGEYYPRGTRAGGFLAAYARQFNCIELNTTYYRTPDRAQVLKWYAATPDDFRFCPKVNKAITQAGDLATSNSRALDFAKSVQHFEHKLGPCFAQLPATFGSDRADTLRAFLDGWPPSVRLALELRHESWFETETGRDVFAELKARGHGAVITDVGGRRDVAHMNVTGDYAMVRWVGTLHAASDEERLRVWAGRVRGWLASGLPEAYVFTHEPEPTAAARAATHFAAALRAATPEVPVRVRAPSPLTPGADATGGGGGHQAELFG